MLVRRIGLAALLCSWLPLAAGAQSRPVFRESRIADNSGRIPSGIAAGDFNEDGVLDVVTANSTTGTITTFLQVEGDFLPATELQIGNVPMGIVTGTFDADERPDVLVSNGSDASLSFARGIGNGEFEVQGSAIGVGVSPSGMAVADLNGDSELDVVVATEGLSETAPGSLTVLHGSGNGTFTSVADLTTDLGTRAVAIGQLTDDTSLDLVAANSRGNCFTFCRGLGDGRRFNCATCVPTGIEPLGIAVGDLDGDGDNDVVTADKNSDAVSLYANDGLGAFAARVTLPVGTFPTGVAIGDFNADGRRDIAATNSLSGDVSVILGRGAGQFSVARQYVADGQPGPLAVADFDSDDVDDVVTANVTGNDGSVASFRSRGDGVLHAVEDVPAAAGPNGVACSDSDGDGRPDLLVAHGDGTVRAFSPNASGEFSMSDPLYEGATARGVIAEDLNRDGFPDMAVVDKDANTLIVRLGRGGGAFATAQIYDTATSPAAIAAGDFDGDGKVDLAVTAFGPPGQVNLFFGRGSTASNYNLEASSRMLQVGETPTGIKAANLDGANGDDLVVVSESMNSVAVLKNSGDGTFEVSDSITGAGPRALLLGLYDTDEFVDLVIGNTVAVTQPGIIVYAGKGDGTFTRPGTSIRTERVDALVARDVSGDRCVDLIAVDQTSNASRLFKGNCMGRFTLDRESNANLSRMPVALAAGDFDGNGFYDGVSANSQMTANNLSVLWNCTGEANCSPVPSGASAAVRGEANDDGAVSAGDLVQLVREIGDGDGRNVEDTSRSMPAALPGVDANGDGIVDVADGVAVAHRIFAGG